MWWIQTFGLWGQFDKIVFPLISRLFLRWRGAKVYRQTGWGTMAGFDPPGSVTGCCLEFDLRFKTPPLAILFALSSLSFAILDCLISRLCCLFNLRCSFSFCFSVSFLCLFHLHLKCFLCS